MEPLVTERLTIRNFAEADWSALKKIVVQYQASPYAAYDHQWPTDDEELKKITVWFAGGDEFLAVCQRDADRLIGYVALNRTAREGEFSIGYCFNFDYHGKGYASEACLAMTDYAFSNLSAERLTAGTAMENRPSRRLLERLGMKLIRQEVSSFCKTESGKPIEFLGGLFELTRDDWMRNRRTGAVR